MIDGELVMNIDAMRAKGASPAEVKRVLKLSDEELLAYAAYDEGGGRPKGAVNMGDPAEYNHAR